MREAAEDPDHGQLQSRPVSRTDAGPARTEGRGWLLKSEGWRRADRARGARMGDYAAATDAGRPSPRECGTAAAGVWDSRDPAEEEEVLGPGGFPGLH